MNTIPPKIPPARNINLSLGDNFSQSKTGFVQKALPPFETQLKNLTIFSNVVSVSDFGVNFNIYTPDGYFSGIVVLYYPVTQVYIKSSKNPIKMNGCYNKLGVQTT